MADGVVEGESPAPHAILVVDDVPANLVACRATLESLGREIVTATSRGEATRLLRRRQFSLLLIDVRTSRPDGFATVELLRDRLHRLTPVIFMTGVRDDIAMRRAYQFGAVDYLVEPVPPEILRGKVRTLLALYDASVELEQRAERLLEQGQRLVEAEALLRGKDSNIAVLSHDLRNPLAAIMMSAAALARLSEASEKARRIARRIDQSALRMTGMIRDILDYTRGRLGGGIALSRQPTDLAMLSRSVVDEIRAGYPMAHIDVETAGELTGAWDPARIEQALSNLIANAVQHGSPNVKLIASGEDPDHVVVTVRNSGPPIPKERLSTLFDAFKKGQDSAGGLGLGLFIVREIVRAHEGSVAVASSAEGTAFTFRLPRWKSVDDGLLGDEVIVSVSALPSVPWL